MFSSLAVLWGIVFTIKNFIPFTRKVWGVMGLRTSGLPYPAFPLPVPLSPTSYPFPCYSGHLYISRVKTHPSHLALQFLSISFVFKYFNRITTAIHVCFNSMKFWPIVPVLVYLLCKMGFTSLHIHDFYGSWHLYICHPLFGHSTFFVTSLLFMNQFRLV